MKRTLFVAVLVLFFSNISFASQAVETGGHANGGATLVQSFIVYDSNYFFDSARREAFGWDISQDEGLALRITNIIKPTIRVVVEEISFFSFDNIFREKYIFLVFKEQIQNSSNTDWQNIKLMSFFPKELFSNETEVTSTTPFSLISKNEHGFFLETIFNLPSGTFKEIKFKKVISKEDYYFRYSNELNRIKSPIIASLREEVPPVNKCIGVSCDDANPCTVDSCSSSIGNCNHFAVVEGTVCGIEKNCIAGNCTADFNKYWKSKPKQASFFEKIITFLQGFFWRSD